MDNKRIFNEVLQDLWEDPDQILTDHNSEEVARVYKGVIFTDGSGTRGKCSKTTPAGWGWCFQRDDQWIEAFGPVVTDPNHLLYRGAQVGSNNTGELTAILEAVIYAIDHNWHTVSIKSDSLWSIKVMKGIWRAMRHKQLVNYIKSLIRNSSLKVQLEWIKAHVGFEGNERADRLAEEGKNSIGRFGTNSLPPTSGPRPVIAPEASAVIGGLRKRQHRHFITSIFSPAGPGSLRLLCRNLKKLDWPKPTKTTTQAIYVT